MYYFKELVSKYNLEKQLPECKIYATDNRLVIDSIDYRLSVYGWPDNRVVTSNKITGTHRIRRFGPNGKEKCRALLMTCLETLGVDTLEADWDMDKIKSILNDCLCDECRRQT